MTIDSPDIAENSQDLSTATLVVDDSDDAYYDKFDPIPEDLVLFDNDKYPAPGTFHVNTCFLIHISSSYPRNSRWSGRPYLFAIL